MARRWRGSFGKAVDKPRIGEEDRGKEMRQNSAEPVTRGEIQFATPAFRMK